MPIPAEKIEKLPDAELDCLRCGTRNKNIGSLRLAEVPGEGDFFGQVFSGLFEGIEVDAQICPHCGKLEFFS